VQGSDGIIDVRKAEEDKEARRGTRRRMGMKKRREVRA
jgi:hypothetical protein